MSMLLIATIILKSWMNREVHVQFCEEQGVRSPLLTRLCVRVCLRGGQMLSVNHLSQLVILGIVL